MQTLWWTLTILLMTLGLLGTLVPFIPGTLIIFSGALLNYLTLGAIGGKTLLVLGILLIVAQTLDILSGTMGAKFFGATRWGILGGICGALIGVFFGIIGLILGPLLGVLIAELLVGQGVLSATRSSCGTVLGTMVGMIAKLAIGILMIVYFFIAAST